MVKTDVTQEDEMLNLYEKALSLNDRIDVWINNAGVLSLGEFSAVPWKISKQTVMTNLIGPMYCAYLVAPHFKNNKQGIMIQMNSLSAYVSTPYVTAYSASKIGLRGFSEALRYEMSSYKDIHICDVFATFLDTTGLDHAANFTGVKLAPSPPVYDPCDVAQSIVKLIKKPKSNIHLGINSYVGITVHSLSPEFLGRFMSKMTHLYFKLAPKARYTGGNLISPLPDGNNIHGGWRGLGLLRRLKEKNHLQLRNQTKP